MGQFLNNSTYSELILSKMERKIGEVFEYQGKILQVKEEEGIICEGCLFLSKCTSETKGTVGWCDCGKRSDKKNVIFVEVKEQQEPETVKERKIGEVFEYQGKKIMVKAGLNCEGCILKGKCTLNNKAIVGECGSGGRTDGTSVLFVEVQEHQAEEPKERKVGEVFEYKGLKLKVMEETDGCTGCCFREYSCPNHKIVGECLYDKRSDNKGVIFIDITDESANKPQSQEQTEQPQQTEKPKERKIGEVFEYEGRKLKVVESSCDECRKCFFFYRDCKSSKDERGFCGDDFRTDKKNVIFVECYNEQSQEQTEQQPKEEPQLNLCELLRYCPKGTEFYSPMLGNVKLNSIDHAQQRVFVILETGEHWYINSDATITLDSYVTSAEIMLYPSREQRDWSKVKYEPKKELPRTWVEFCASHDITMSEYYIGETCKIFNSNSGKRIPDISKTILPNRQAAEAHLAYMQLHQLRDAWREGWLPDWKDDMQAKFSIVCNNGEYSVFDYQYVSRFLSFQDKDRAKEFLKCFKDLIKKAGDLI